ncbi:4'-phosphopantetheinyl transferase family protein [Segatella bryantii]|uniref:Siderophore biosynthesis protein n=1 Tax=Segatella bryantii TaxID=77095 RepID=A0ABX4EES0_SEGBR|nr:siderophore biosynthesis protein [Segatella bryantii]OYP53589.1 siderophore biosynthesis protein [Segatella bryantii]UKK81411.1 siderophore biosynthesis protein [Segatella bryantii]
MALLFIRHLWDDVNLGIWAIEETVEQLFEQYPHLKDLKVYLDEKYKNEGRKKEILAIRALLYEMTHEESSKRISHEPSGKPLLKGYFISISHTKGYAAVIMSKTRNVAVDIEYVSDRVSKIVDKFIRSDEDSSTIEVQLKNWCAKETVYKYFSEEDLQYSEMRLHDLSSSHALVDDLKIKKTIDVFFDTNSQYVLAYSY